MHAICRRLVTQFHPNLLRFGQITRSNWHSSAAAEQMPHLQPRELVVLDSAEITEDLAGRRLDACLAALFPRRYSSATGVKRAVRRKEVRVNSETATIDTIMKQGDTVQVVSKLGGGQVPQGSEAKPGLDTAFEDDHMAVIIKPQGIPTQGKGEGTVQGRIKYCLKPTPLPGALFRPHQVHRLDAATGGLLLVAKTRAAAAALALDLAQHNMQKRYLALLVGRLEGDGIVDFPLQGKAAVTLFSVLEHCPSESFGTLTWVSLWPKTGRTHQLRKHLAYLGCPILGDAQYRLHRKPECTAQPVADVRQHLPQLVVQQEQQQEQQQEDAPAAKRRCVTQEQEDTAAADDARGAGALAAGASSGTSTAAAAAAAAADGDFGDEEEEDDEAAAAAAAAAAGDGDGSSSGGQQRKQLLRDGSCPPMCLWSVQLNLLHPITREPMKLKIDRPVSLYRGICRVEAVASSV